MPMRRAVDARVLLRGTLYATQEFSFDETSQLDDCSNTEGVPANTALGSAAFGYASKLCDIISCRVMIRNATFDDTSNPFALPIALSAGFYLPVRVYPAGLGGVSWNIPNMAVSGVSHGGRVPGPQPITITGESDGLFSHPLT